MRSLTTVSANFSFLATGRAKSVGFTQLIYLVIFLFYISSCIRKNPCEGLPGPKTYNFKINVDSNKLEFPNLGTNDLVYVNNFGDTARLKCITPYENYWVDEGSGNLGSPECPWHDTYRREYVRSFYKGNNDVFYDIEMLLYNDQFREDRFEITINERSIFSGRCESVFDTTKYDCSTNYKGKLTTGRLTYESAPEYLKFCFNKRIGIISITFNDTNTYFLQ